jgi:ferric-dicitrate binding protein FerR (iron transport regulator)
MDKEKFSELVDKYLEGAATREEKYFLETYYEELQTGKTIENLLSEEQINSLETEMFNKIEQATQVGKVKKISAYKKYSAYAAIAASVLIAVSVGYFIKYKNGNLTENQTVYSKAGNVIKLQLSDGTMVWLNAGSKLSFPSSFKERKLREIYLEGEAYFEVKNDMAHPFLVHTKNLTTRDLGTKFNVQAYNDTKSIEVTLLEGKVMLTTDITGTRGDKKKKSDTLYLKPNEKAVLYADVLKRSSIPAAYKNDMLLNQHSRPKDTSLQNVMLSKRTLSNAAIASSWRNGELTFNDEPLENVLASLRRKYNIVINASPALAEYPISGTYLNERIDDILLDVTRQIKRKVVKGDIISKDNVQYKKLGSNYYIE